MADSSMPKQTNRETQTTIHINVPQTSGTIHYNFIWISIFYRCPTCYEKHRDRFWEKSYSAFQSQFQYKVPIFTRHSPNCNPLGMATINKGQNILQTDTEIDYNRTATSDMPLHKFLPRFIKWRAVRKTGRDRMHISYLNLCLLNGILKH